MESMGGERMGGEGREKEGRGREGKRRRGGEGKGGKRIGWQGKGRRKQERRKEKGRGERREGRGRGGREGESGGRGPTTSSWIPPCILSINPPNTVRLSLRSHQRSSALSSLSDSAAESESWLFLLVIDTS